MSAYKRRAASKLPANPESRTVTKTVKFSTKEEKELANLVGKFSGSWSTFIRAAVLAYTPKESDFE